MRVSAFAESNAQGVYVGYGYAFTHYGDSNYINEIVSTPQLSTNSSGIKCYIGYQFDDLLALELGYTDLGTFTSGLYSQSMSSTTLAITLRDSFLNEQLHPYFLFGQGFVNSNANYHQEARSLRFALHLGIGIDYTPNNLYGLGLRLAYEADIYTNTATYRDEEHQATKKEYLQSLQQFYLALQYKF